MTTGLLWSSKEHSRERNLALEEEIAEVKAYVEYKDEYFYRKVGIEKLYELWSTFITLKG